VTCLCCFSPQLCQWGVWRRFNLCWGKCNTGRLSATGRDSKVLPATGSAAGYNRPTGLFHQRWW